MLAGNQPYMNHFCSWVCNQHLVTFKLNKFFVWCLHYFAFPHASELDKEAIPRLSSNLQVFLSCFFLLHFSTYLTYIFISFVLGKKVTVEILQQSFQLSWTPGKIDMFSKPSLHIVPESVSRQHELTPFLPEKSLHSFSL